MGNFKVGDRVVCVDDSGNHFTNLVKGRCYFVYSIRLSPCCGSQKIDVGLHCFNGCDVVNCMDCGGIYRDNSSDVRVTRFRKVEEKKEVNYVKLEIEIEEPCLN